MTGYLLNNLMQPADLQARHDSLAEEMTRRGMNHASPLQEVDWDRFKPQEGMDITVDLDMAWDDLVTRCPDCAKLKEER